MCGKRNIYVGTGTSMIRNSRRTVSLSWLGWGEVKADESRLSFLNEVKSHYSL